MSLVALPFAGPAAIISPPTSVFTSFHSRIPFLFYSHRSRDARGGGTSRFSPHSLLSSNQPTPKMKRDLARRAFLPRGTPPAASGARRHVGVRPSKARGPATAKMELATREATQSGAHMHGPHLRCQGSITPRRAGLTNEASCLAAGARARTHSDRGPEWMAAAESGYGIGPDSLPCKLADPG